MKHAEPRLFEKEEIERKLSELGDPLEKLSPINWEIFRETIENVLERKDLSKGGRPPYDSILLFSGGQKRLYPCCGGSFQSLWQTLKMKSCASKLRRAHTMRGER